jgi:hypothetical protein
MGSRKISRNMIRWGGEKAQLPAGSRPLKRPRRSRSGRLNRFRLGIRFGLGGGVLGVDPHAVAVVGLGIVEGLVGGGQEVLEGYDVLGDRTFGDADAQGRLVIEVRDRVALLSCSRAF